MKRRKKDFCNLFIIFVHSLFETSKEKKKSSFIPRFVASNRAK